MNYYVSKHSDIGNSREENEDTILFSNEETAYGQVLICGVFDGMGGMDEGKYASHYAGNQMFTWFRCSFIERIENGLTLEQVQNEWISLFENINAELVEYGNDNNKKVGTTATVILFLRNKYMAIHIGDSRLYEISDVLIQLSEDMTLAQREINKGILSEEEARYSRKRHVLLSCLGINNDIKYQFIFGDINQNVAYLLCSDGFYDKLSIEDIKLSSIKSEQDMKDILFNVTEKVKELGETDNISSVLIKGYEE